MKAAYRMALILSLAALGATSVEAAPITGPNDEALRGVRVVNNYNDVIRVYAEDAAGHLHKLGRVARGALVEFEIPAEVAATGSFRIRIHPGQPAWSLEQDNYAVKTNPLNLQGDTDVTVWVEPELTHTVVEMSRG